MSVQEEIDQRKPWFHNIHLPDGSQTAPDHFLGDFPKFKWEPLKKFIPADLSGWKVLDIGCNGGFYTIELAKRGADVLAIDMDEHYLDQAAWAVDSFGLSGRVRLRQMQVYDLAGIEEKFDLVWFMGVFYHLRYPLLALDIVTSKVNNLLIFQSLTMPGGIADTPDDLLINDRKKFLDETWPKMAFIEKTLNGDPTNWWAPNQAAAAAMLRSCGMKIIGQTDDETFIAENDLAATSDLNAWNKSEFLSAIGKEWRHEIEKKTANK